MKQSRILDGADERATADVREGRSLLDLLIREAKRLVDKPAVAEIHERLARRSTVNTGMSAAEAVRRERDQR